MCVRDGALCAMALAVLFGACEHEEIGYWPDSEITVGKDIATAPSDSETSEDDSTSGDTGEGPSVITGLACEEDSGCATDFCLNDAFLANFGLAFTIPGGMCSLFPCFDDSECGPNALCVDGEPLGAPGISLCLATCRGMLDCRWEEDWSCVAPLPDDEPELQVCLPDNIIVSLECEDEDIQCEEEAP